MQALDRRIQALEAQLRKDHADDSDSEIYERLKCEPGYDLSLVPGETLADKVRSVVAAYDGKLQLLPEARHAARGWFNVLDAI